MELTETWRWLIQLLVAALAIGTAAWFYLDFAPRLRPTIEVAGRDHEHGLVVLRLSVENVSRVLVHNVRGGCRLQVVARPLAPGTNYTDFVPFSEEKWDEDANAQVGSWAEPAGMLNSTRHWYPGDRITVDHLVAFPDVPAACLHVALQVRGRLPWYVRIVMGARTGRDGQRQPSIESWTTTTFILPEPSP